MGYESSRPEVASGFLTRQTIGIIAVVLIASVCSLFSLILVVKAIYRIWYHPLARFPGPKLYALTEVTSDWMSYVRGTWIHQVRNLHAEYGPIVRVGTKHLVLDGGIGWPILAHKSGKPEFGKQPGFYFPASATLVSWVRRRRCIDIKDASWRMRLQLAKRAGDNKKQGQTVNIVEWLNFLTFDMIGDLAISTLFESLEAGAYHEWIANFLNGVEGATVQRFMRFYPYLAPMTMGMIQDRMGLGEQGKSGKEHRDFMTYMLRRNRDGENGMSNVEIMSNAPVLIAAGSETTATALAGLFFFLGTNRDIYRRLVDKIRGAFRTEEEISLRAIAKLEYLQATLEEGLRLYPPVAELPRRICPGAEIDGKWVPKGTVISVHQWSTFRNPAHFAEPDSFRPERFLLTSHPLYDGARFGGDNRAVSKPFSFGSRDCIGKNLAFAEMRAVVVRLLHRFDVVLEPGQENWLNSQRTYVMWHTGPLKVRLRAKEL
ncbi:cytochrome P450 [Xylariaceae sp. FL0255]|nr:cytochrome P450 [Xylariaceae sp. FL0255]